LYSNTIGNNNTAIGNGSGGNNITGSSNVFIGYQSGMNELGSNTLYIENSNADAENALIYGEFDNNILRTNGEFQIGIPSGTGYAFPTTDGSANQLLVTDGVGQVSFIDASSVADDDWTDVGADIERQSGNVYIGDTNATNNDLYVSDRIIDWDATNYYLDPDNISKVDEIEFDSGSVSDPSIRFSGGDTGFYSPSNATTAYSASGTEAFRIHSSGKISIGTTSSSTYDIYMKNSFNAKILSIGANNSNNNPLIDATINGDATKNIINANVLSSNRNFSHTAIKATSQIGDVYVAISENLGTTIFGLRSVISEDNTSGNKYGLYSEATKLNSYAGYFLGKVSFGTTTANNYIFPSTRGTNGQVMITDGSGNISWVDTSTIDTDDQTIDQFALSGTTLGISIEDDGASPVTVDLSSLAGDDDWTDVGADIERQNGNVYIGDTNATNNDLYISDRIIDWDSALYYLDPDDISKVDEIQFDSGSSADPSIRFLDATTGFFSPTNGVTAYSSFGSEAFRISSLGDISIGAVASSDYKLLIESPVLASKIYIGNKSNNSSIMRIEHNSTTGDGILVDVNSSYTLASRAAFTGYNSYAGVTTNIAKYLSGSRVYGVENSFSGNISLPIYGVYNFISNSGSSTHYGTHNRLLGAGNGIKYGSYNYIPNTAGGIHYGVYSYVPKASSYAGYFLGRVSIGTDVTDKYIFPSSRGSNGQVMRSDGSGNLSWATPSTGTDDQTIDQFALSGTTLGISLEDDGVAPLTVDLSSIQDGTGTDDQTVDQFVLSGTTLGLSLEDDGAAPYTVDLSSLQDGTGTDDQNISGSVLSGTNLTIGIENGTNQVIDLSSLQDGTGTDNQNITSATLTGTSLAIAIENGSSASVDLSPLQDADWFETGGTPPNSISDDIYTNGNVGIGVNLPTYKLDVRETAASDYVAQILNYSTNTTSDALKIKISAAVPNTSNNFIGFFDGSNNIRGKITGTVAGVNYATTSDRRLKTKIISIDNALSLIENIQPRKYEYKANLGTTEYGFIAQELQLIYPQAVIGSSDSNVKTDPMMVDYSRLTPILTAGIKELNDKVVLLETENKKLKQQLSKYEQLEARLSALENKSNLSATDLVVMEE